MLAAFKSFEEVYQSLLQKQFKWHEAEILIQKFEAVSPESAVLARLHNMMDENDTCTVATIATDFKNMNRVSDSELWTAVALLLHILGTRYLPQTSCERFMLADDKQFLYHYGRITNMKFLAIGSEKIGNAMTSLEHAFGLYVIDRTLNI